MRKFLVSIVCGLLVVGIASMGHASLFGLFNGSGNGKGGRGGSSGPPPEVFKHEFKQLVAQPPNQHSDRSDSEPFNIKEYVKGPVESNPYFGDHDRRQDDVVPGNGFGPVATDGIGGGHVAKIDPPTQNADAAPVPEPATLFLLGIGLIGLARYGRKNFNN